MTPAAPSPADRILAVLPAGCWHSLRWIIHRGGLSHGAGVAAAQELLEAGLLEVHPDSQKGDWRAGAVLLRRVT